jgi:hypothetical protein
MALKVSCLLKHPTLERRVISCSYGYFKISLINKSSNICDFIIGNCLLWKAVRVPRNLCTVSQILFY